MPVSRTGAANRSGDATVQDIAIVTRLANPALPIAARLSITVGLYGVDVLTELQSAIGSGVRVVRRTSRAGDTFFRSWCDRGERCNRPAASDECQKETGEIAHGAKAATLPGRKRTRRNRRTASAGVNDSQIRMLVAYVGNAWHAMVSRLRNR